MVNNLNEASTSQKNILFFTFNDRYLLLLPVVSDHEFLC
jgi:hypothetical protein